MPRYKLTRFRALLYLVTAAWLAYFFWIAPAHADSNQAYVTGAPMPGMLGLAESDGRYAITLGDGCDGVQAGQNVALESDGTLQVIDPLNGLEPDVCHFTILDKVSGVPCGQRDDGTCDVADS